MICENNKLGKKSELSVNELRLLRLVMFRSQRETKREILFHWGGFWCCLVCLSSVITYSVCYIKCNRHYTINLLTEVNKMELKKCIT